MAKRSVEIVVGAANKTAGPLAEAKAEVRRWADEVKRIQQATAAAARGGDIGRALGQAGLRGGAAERLETARAAAEGRAALQERLRGFQQEKAAQQEIWAAARQEGAAQAAMDERRLAARRQLAGMAREELNSFQRLGKVIMGAGLAIGAFRSALIIAQGITGAIKGDLEGVAKAIYRLPFGIGEAMREAGHLVDMWTGQADNDKLIAEQAERRDTSQILRGIRVAAVAELRYLKAGPREREELTLSQQYATERAKINALESQNILAGPQAEEARKAATLASWERFADLYRRHNAEDAERSQAAAAEKQRAADAAARDAEEAAQRHADRMAGLTYEAAEARIQATKDGAERETALLKLQMDRELADATLTEEAKTLIRQTYADRQRLIDQRAATAKGGDKTRAITFGGLGAVDRGFLTGAPGQSDPAAEYARVQKKMADDGEMALKVHHAVLGVLNEISRRLGVPAVVKVLDL